MTVGIRGSQFHYSETSSPAVLAWPSGTAIGDIAVLVMSDDASTDIIPTGWTALPSGDPGCYKVLNSGDIASSLSQSVTPNWSAWLFVTYGTVATGIIDIAESGSNPLSFGSFAAGAGPYAVMHSIAYFSGSPPPSTSDISLDPALTIYNDYSQDDPGSGNSLYSVVAGYVQPGIGASPARTFDGNGGPGPFGELVSVRTLALIGTDDGTNHGVFSLHLAVSETVTGGVSGSSVFFHLDLSGTNSQPVTEWPAPDPAEPTYDPIADDDLTIRHVSEDFPDPVLEDGVPTNWGLI